MPIDQAWLKTQVQEFTAVRPRYDVYRRVIETILQHATAKICPAAIVQARAKAVKSFAAKCVKYAGLIQAPVSELTDLCGARVIVQLPREVDAMIRFVRDTFLIDEANSQDTKVRLGAHEFGYRSVHLIVQIDP